MAVAAAVSSASKTSPPSVAMGDSEPHHGHSRTLRKSRSHSMDDIESPHRRQVVTFLKSATMEVILGVLISCSVVIIILETDATADGSAAPAWMRWLNMFFLVVYAFEAVVKIYAFRCHYFHDSWNLLDFTVVCLDTVLIVVGFFQISSSGVSIVRIFRICKMARIFRVLRQIWELKMLLMSFAAAAKSILFGMGMVLIMGTIWSVLAVQLIHPINKQIWEGQEETCERCARAFSSVWNSLITIFQTVVAGDGWGFLAVPIIEHSMWTCVYFLSVLVSVQLAMLNLILAVIVERAAAAKEMDLMERAMAKEDEMLKGKATLLELCQLIDSDASGSLDVDEFKSGFENNPEFASSLMTMGVFLEDVHLLFDVLDVEGSGTVPYVELVDTLARLKSHISYVILYQLTAIQKHMRDIAQREAPPKEPVFKLAKAEEDPVPAKLREDKYHPVPEKLEGAQGFRDLLDRRFAEMMADNKRRMDQIIEEMDHSFSQAQRLESDIKAPVKKCYSSILEALDHSSSVVLEMLRAEVVPGLNELNDNGETSLLLAIKRQKWEVALAILQRQDFTRLNALDKLGLSCWHHCLVRDRSDVAAAIRHRPDFDVPVALSGEAISRCATESRTWRPMPVRGI